MVSLWYLCVNFPWFTWIGLVLNVPLMVRLPEGILHSPIYFYQGGHVVVKFGAFLVGNIVILGLGGMYYIATYNLPWNNTASLEVSRPKRNKKTAGVVGAKRRRLSMGHQLCKIDSLNRAALTRSIEPKSRYALG